MLSSADLAFGDAQRVNDTFTSSFAASMSLSFDLLCKHLDSLPRPCHVRSKNLFAVLLPSEVVGGRLVVRAERTTKHNVMINHDGLSRDHHGTGMHSEWEHIEDASLVRMSHSV